MPHEPGHDDCPPPGGGGYQALDRKAPYMGQIGIYHVYGEGNEHLQCPCIVLSVNDGSLGSIEDLYEGKPTVNVNLWLNSLSGTTGHMVKQRIHQWEPPK